MQAFALSMIARVEGSLRSRPLCPGRAGRRTSDRGPLNVSFGVYATLVGATVVLCWATGRNPLVTSPLLEGPAWLLLLASLGAGALLAVGTIFATRVLVRRARWVRALFLDLRSTVHGATGGTLVVLGLASGLAEELLFRGLLVPLFGVILPALAFGAIHRLRGASGLVWSAWAALMGLLFGSVFAATGNLVGPIVAHVVINVVNLRFLRDAEPVQARPKELGGLLRSAARDSGRSLKHVDPVVDRPRHFVR